MCKIATCFSKENIATLSQQFSYSHLIEFVAIEEKVKRGFYMFKWQQKKNEACSNSAFFERIIK